MKKVNDYIKNNINKIATIFLFSQPFLDVFATLKNTYLISFFEIGTIIRLLFMVFLIYYTIFISNFKYKKICIIYILLVVIFFVLYSINAYTNMDSILYELKALVKNLYFPILLVGFINIYSDNKFNNKNFIHLMYIYTSILIFSELLGLGHSPYDYSQTKKIGHVGLFYSGNEISGILTVLLPFSLNYIFNNKINIMRVILLLEILITTFLIGTKTIVLGLFIVLAIELFIKIKKLFKEKRYKFIVNISSVTLILTVSILLILPSTPIYKNIETHIEYLKINNILDIFKGNNFNHLVLGSRLTYLNNTKVIYENSNTMEKILGLGYSFKEHKLIEIDYFDIYYRNGIIGFVVMLSPLLVVIYYIVNSRRKISKNKNNYIYITSITLGLLLALFTGHIITAPGVCIYISLILSLMYNVKE